MDLFGKRFLVTGGCGFIGSHITEYLLSNGAYVRVLDNLATGNLDNIKHLLDNDRLEYMWGDIRDYQTCLKACSNIDAVTHQAAMCSVPRSIDDPKTSHDVNVTGFFNILEAARQNNIKRVVYSSSSSVYGDNQDDLKTEEKIGTQKSPYAVTKHIDELYGGIYTHTYGMECIGLRYFNVFGPRQNPNGVYAAVIPRFAISVLQNKSVTINGDGSFSRGFTFVDNVVDANVLALTSNNDKCFGQLFNVGTGSCFTIQEILDDIRSIVGNDVGAEYLPVRAGDLPHSNADINKITELLGYHAKVGFVKGLVDTIDYYRTIAGNM